MSFPTGMSRFTWQRCLLESTLRTNFGRKKGKISCFTPCFQSLKTHFSFEIRESFFLKQGRCFLLGRAASASPMHCIVYTHLSTMKEPTTNHYLEVLERRRDLLPLYLWDTVLQRRIQRYLIQEHQSSYLIYDTAFIPDRWGKFDKPTRDMSFFPRPHPGFDLRL